MLQSGIYTSTPCCHVPASCHGANNNRTVFLESTLRVEFPLLQIQVWTQMSGPDQSICLVLSLPPGCENVFGSGSILWRGIMERGGQERSLSIPCVFSGLFLQPRPALMAEENHWQFGSWNIGFTGYTPGSDITWPVMAGKVIVV